MAYQRVNVESVSFGLEGSCGIEHLLSGTTEVLIDQRQSETESAGVKVQIEIAPDWDGWKTLNDLRVSIRLVLSDKRVCIFPKCLHEVDPPTAVFTAQDIEDEGPKYWAVVDGNRILENKKVDF